MTSAALDIDAAAARLCDDDAPLVILGEDWCRSYGRLAPDKRAYATLVYEKPTEVPVRVDFFTDRQSIECVALPQIGYAAFQSAVHDTALPTLADALALVNNVEIIRYRPGKRCTFSGLERGSRAPLFLKTFSDDRGAEIFQDAKEIDYIANDGAFGFSVAAPAWYDCATRTIAHRTVPGTPIGARLEDEDGPALAKNIGAALATIPQSQATPLTRFTASDQMRRTAKYARRIASTAAWLEPVVTRIMEKFSAAHDAIPDSPLRPIHGAPHPQQWLISDDALGLIDFDRFSMGPVEIDAATFVAELDFEGISAPQRNNLIASFVTQYDRDVNGVNHRLFTTYRAHKHMAKALKTALAIRPDRLARAEQILRGAEEMLDGIKK